MSRLRRPPATPAMCAVKSKKRGPSLMILMLQHADWLRTTAVRWRSENEAEPGPQRASCEAARPPAGRGRSHLLLPVC